jgi:transcriptional regulator with XRE-family HTH domain
MYVMHVMNEQSEHIAASRPTPEQFVGRQVRLLRQGRGWSQQEVAQKMGAYGYRWSQATVTRLEAASRPIRLNELADLAALFDIPVTKFMEGWSLLRTLGWDDLEALQNEIGSLDAKRADVQRQLDAAHAAEIDATQAGAAAAAELAAMEWRLEVLTRWHSQAAQAAQDRAEGDEAQ